MENLLGVAPGNGVKETRELEFTDKQTPEKNPLSRVKEDITASRWPFQGADLATFWGKDEPRKTRIKIQGLAGIVPMEGELH